MFDVRYEIGLLLMVAVGFLIVLLFGVLLELEVFGCLACLLRWDCVCFMF